MAHSWPKRWDEDLHKHARFRRIAFKAWAAILVAVFGVAFFGVTSLVIAWFEDVEGVAGPVTDLGYGVLIGIVLTTGLVVQLRGPEWRIAGVQQAFLVIPALVIGSAIASDSQNLVPALILLPAIGILLALHPARGAFFRRGAAPSRIPLAITAIAAVPFIAYALDMGAQARDLAGPPHHVQRLSTMAAMAVAIVLTSLLAALRTRGWRIPTWSAGVAASVFGLASVVFPDQPGGVGRGWGGMAVVGGVLFIAVGEWEVRRRRPRDEEPEGLDLTRDRACPPKPEVVFPQCSLDRARPVLPRIDEWLGTRHRIERAARS